MRIMRCDKFNKVLFNILPKYPLWRYLFYRYMSKRRPRCNRGHQTSMTKDGNNGSYRGMGWWTNIVMSGVLMCRYQYSIWKAVPWQFIFFFGWKFAPQSINDICSKSTTFYYMRLPIIGYITGGLVEMVQLGAQMEWAQYSVRWMRNL